MTYMSCWKLELLDELDQQVYFTKSARFKGLCKSRQVICKYTMELFTMALKPKMANQPILDESGYAIGKLVDVSFQDSDESEFENEQFCFSFQVPGKLKPIVFRFWTTTKLDSRKLYGANNNDYSAFTKFALASNLVDSDKLSNLTEQDLETIGDNLQELVGKDFKFKLSKVKSSALSKIDLNTIQLV